MSAYKGGYVIYKGRHIIYKGGHGIVQVLGQMAARPARAVQVLERHGRRLLATPLLEGGVRGASEAQRDLVTERDRDDATRGYTREGMSFTREGGVFTREGGVFTREGGVFTREGMSFAWEGGVPSHDEVPDNGGRDVAAHVVLVDRAHKAAAARLFPRMRRRHGRVCARWAARASNNTW